MKNRADRYDKPKVTLLVKYFSPHPTDDNYSELYSRMVVEMVDNAIVTTYYSRATKKRASQTRESLV